jgi:hypothetical protein
MPAKKASKEANNLPGPDVVAQEIVADLEAALEQGSRQIFARSTTSVVVLPSTFRCKVRAALI